MAELADAQVSEACGGNPVEVQVLFRAFFQYFLKLLSRVESGDVFSSSR
jgi:hypothetical protein